MKQLAHWAMQSLMDTTGKRRSFLFEGAALGTAADGKIAPCRKSSENSLFT
jgi:hypothetical protein